MKIIIFSAIWCPSCLVMRPRFAKVFNNIEITEYDYDLNNNEVKEYNVGKVIPVVILMNNNQEVKRIIGEKSIKELESILEEVRK